MAKLLITGGAGFIGSNFIHYWLDKYSTDEIINLDKLTYAGNLENLAGLENNPRYVFVLGDITDVELVERLVAQVDIIVHFAAESHVDRSIVSSAEFITTNVLGTQVLLEAARKNKTRFHHISTDEVFGTLQVGDPGFNESTPYSPRSPYSASKAASDHLARAYYHTYGVPVTISNCSNNYGPRQHPEKLIPLFITNLIEGKKVPVYGSGKNIRDWIHVDDHNRGVDLILHHGKIGETYCLGGNSERTNLEITRQLITALGKDESFLEYVPDRLGHDFRYAIDFTKAKDELGFSPQIDLASGLAQTIKWYKEHEAWWRKLKK